MEKSKTNLIENGQSIGIEMENGIKIYSKNVVSSIGVRNIFNKLTTNYELKIINFLINIIVY